MKAVMFSINRPHTDNIKSGAKISELRTRPPKIDAPYKAYIYETLKNGGSGQVIGEFTAYNERTYRMCMGVPSHLVICGCISVEEIWAYTNKGEKDLTEISITDLVIYDKPKELSEFYRKCDKFACESCGHLDYEIINDDEFEFECEYFCEYSNCYIPITRPPRSWCYVESEVSE